MNLIARVTAMSRPTLRATILMPGQRISTMIVLPAKSSQRNRKMTRHPLGPFSCSFGLLKYLPAIYCLLLRPQFHHPCSAQFYSKWNSYILKQLERNSVEPPHFCPVPLRWGKWDKVGQTSAFREPVVTYFVTLCHFPHSHAATSLACSGLTTRTTPIGLLYTSVSFLATLSRPLLTRK